MLRRAIMITLASGIFMMLPATAFAEEPPIGTSGYDSTAIMMNNGNNNDYNKYGTDWIGVDENGNQVDLRSIQNKVDDTVNNVDKSSHSLHKNYDEGTITSDNDAAEYGIIDGNDNAVKTNSNDDKSAKGIVYLEIYGLNDYNMTGHKSKCTGSLIGRDTVLTASHCVTGVERNMLVPNTNINVYIFRNENNSSEYKKFKVKTTYVMSNYSATADYKYDMAVLKISPDSNDKYPSDYGTGWYTYGFYGQDFNGENVSMLSYPGYKDKNGIYDSLWKSVGRIDTSDESFNAANYEIKVDNNGRVLYDKNGNDELYKIDPSIYPQMILNNEYNLTHTMPMSQGSSGAGIRWVFNGSKYGIIGVNTRQKVHYKRMIKSDCHSNDKYECTYDEADIHNPYANNIGVRFTLSSYNWVYNIKYNE